MTQDNSNNLRRVGAIAAAAALLATPALASSGLFAIPMVRPCVQARIDPIMNPDEVGGHVHSVYGTCNFRSVLSSPQQMLESGCTGTGVRADGSNYWVPSLYYIRPDNKYEPIPHQSRIYYFINQGRKVHPFPPGMRMIVGNGVNRYQWNENALGNDFKYDQKGTGFYLPNGTNTNNEKPGNIALGIHFPSCGWANQSLDSWDHYSHLTWPISTGGGEVFQVRDGDSCPESHPIMYPHIFLESFYYLTDDQKNQWRTGDVNNVILSNGDTTGRSYHADFVSGWDAKVLGDAIEQCGAHSGGPGDQLQNCPPLVPHLDDGETRANCRHQGLIPDEEIGWFEPLDQLPGCNPRWDRDDGDLKPKTCPWFKGNPKWTPPQALIGEMSCESSLPDAKKPNPDGSFPKPMGYDSYVIPWGKQVDYPRFAKFPKPDYIVTPNSTEWGNGDRDFTAKMGGIPAFDQVNGPGIFDKGQWATDANLPSPSTTYLPFEQYGLRRPTDSVDPALGAKPPAQQPAAVTTAAPSAGSSSASAASSGSDSASTASAGSSASAPAASSSVAAAPVPVVGLLKEEETSATPSSAGPTTAPTDTAAAQQTTSAAAAVTSAADGNDVPLAGNDSAAAQDTTIAAQDTTAAAQTGAAQVTTAAAQETSVAAGSSPVAPKPKKCKKPRAHKRSKRVL